MHSCEGCYYEERSPMEMCNVCTKDADGVLSGWRPKNKTPFGAANSANPASPNGDDLAFQMGRARLEGNGNGEPLKTETETQIIERLRNKNKELEDARDEYAAGCDCLQDKVNQLREELRKANDENNYLRMQLDWNKHENEVMQAKVEMVYLIFGGKNHG